MIVFIFIFKTFIKEITHEGEGWGWWWGCEGEGVRKARSLGKATNEGARKARSVGKATSEGARKARLVGKVTSEGARKAGLVVRATSKGARQLKQQCNDTDLSSTDYCTQQTSFCLQKPTWNHWSVIWNYVLKNIHRHYSIDNRILKRTDVRAYLDILQVNTIQNMLRLDLFRSNQLRFLSF